MRHTNFVLSSFFRLYRVCPLRHKLFMTSDDDRSSLYARDWIWYSHALFYFIFILLSKRLVLNFQEKRNYFYVLPARFIFISINSYTQFFYVKSRYRTYTSAASRDTELFEVIISCLLNKSKRHIHVFV